MSSKPVVRVRVGTALKKGHLDIELLQRYADARLKALTRSVAPFRAPRMAPGVTRRGARRAAGRRQRGSARQGWTCGSKAPPPRTGGGRPAVSVCAC
jgi:hypothetical protein